MIRVDWAALGIVAAVSVLASTLFVVLLAFGVRLVSSAKVTGSSGSRPRGTLSLGYAFVGLSGLLVLYCLYLIVPQFR